MSTDAYTEKIISLLVSFLGEYNNSCGDWYSFNCPCCAENNGGVEDGKYNLEVNVSPLSRGGGGYHCWKCGDTDGMRGFLVQLLKKYAPREISEEIKCVINDCRHTRKFDLSDEVIGDLNNENEISLELPKGFKSVLSDEQSGREAYLYLKGRGITDDLIKRFSIGFIGCNTEKFSLRNRVYIPSYDAYGNLTYWVGRDFTGLNKQKMSNSKRPKTDIVFNEGLINWYEPITIVEGPFDHIATPNSVPLLGKSLSRESALFSVLVSRAKNVVRIFLDDDARKDAIKIYKMLNNTALKGRLRVVIPPSGYDPSLFFQEFGAKEMVNLLCSAEELSDFELLDF